MTDNITVMPNTEWNKIAAELAEFKRIMPLVNEHQMLIAKLRMSAYRSYIGEGFTEIQALELCKDMRA